MKHVLFAAVAAFGLAASVPAFAAVISNDRITTNTTALSQGITLAPIARAAVRATSVRSPDARQRKGWLTGVYPSGSASIAGADLDDIGVISGE
jgi:hypothetical protein